MEFGTFDSRFGVWSFRNDIDPLAYVTVTSETAKAQGAVRHYCRYHLKETSTWRNSDGVTIWTIEDQLAYAKQVEMAVANV
jgi:hypothetical protein